MSKILPQLKYEMTLFHDTKVYFDNFFVLDAKL